MIIKRSRSLLIMLLISMIMFFCIYSASAEDISALKVGTKAYFEAKIKSRIKPPIYKDWNNYADVGGLDIYQLVAMHSVSWDSIEPKGLTDTWGRMGTALGLEWERTSKQFPTLTKNIINIEEAKKRREKILSINPSTMIGVEMRWDAIKEYELPAYHKWWKRNKKGKKIEYSQGDPKRYEMDVYNQEYLAWFGERCKAVLDTGLVDFIFLDHIQSTSYDPLPMLKALREKIGSDAVVIGNTHFQKFPKLVDYLDAWGEKGDEPPVPVIRWWEETGRKFPNFNCWEFVGPEGDYQKMKYYTTLVMTNSNASVRYINHSGGTKPSPWYYFWDAEIGRAKEEAYPKMLSECFTREYENATAVCNDTKEPKTVTFKEVRESVWTGQRKKEFVIEPKDGDMFLYVK